MLSYKVKKSATKGALDIIDCMQKCDDGSETPYVCMFRDNESLQYVYQRNKSETVTARNARLALELHAAGMEVIIDPAGLYVSYAGAHAPVPDASRMSLPRIRKALLDWEEIDHDCPHCKGGTHPMTNFEFAAYLMTVGSRMQHLEMPLVKAFEFDHGWKPSAHDKDQLVRFLAVLVTNGVTIDRAAFIEQEGYSMLYGTPGTRL